MPAGLAQNAKHGGKPKPRAAAIAFGGVEGLKNAGNLLGLHARTFISYFQHHPRAWCYGATLG